MQQKKTKRDTTYIVRGLYRMTAFCCLALCCLKMC